MRRAFPGSTFEVTYPATGGGTFAAIVVDAIGDELPTSLSEADGVLSVTVPPSAWQNVQSGYGRIHLSRTLGGRKEVIASETFRILATPNPHDQQDDYGSSSQHS